MFEFVKQILLMAQEINNAVAGLDHNIVHCGRIRSKQS